MDNYLSSPIIRLRPPGRLRYLNRNSFGTLDSHPPVEPGRGFISNTVAALEEP